MVTKLGWQADRHLWFRADYGIFFAGPFLKQAGPVATSIIGRYRLVTNSKMGAATEDILAFEKCSISRCAFFD
jgi:hypothetical protein